MAACYDIYFRTDGNKEIATGHIMRCLAIARACAEKGAFVKFIVSDEESLSLLRERFVRENEFPVLCLYRDYRKIEAETPADLLSPSQPLPEQERRDDKPWLFIDSYFVTPAYFKAMSSSFKTAYLDDLRSFGCEVDLVVNYDSDKPCPYYEKASDRLLGIQYTPLRAQFRNAAYTLRPKVENILFSTGGTDPYGVAEMLLQKICHSDLPLSAFQYHVVTSKANTRYDALLALSEKNPHIHIHENVADMASLMASCDLAISAGGTTLCELCAVGVPSVSYLMADNQETAVNTFAKAGIIPYAGDIRVQSDVSDRILSFLTDMSQNVELREKSSHAMRAFLDGRGAERIADRLFASSSISARQPL